MVLGEGPASPQHCRGMDSILRDMELTRGFLTEKRLILFTIFIYRSAMEGEEHGKSGKRVVGRRSQFFCTCPEKR